MSRGKDDPTGIVDVAVIQSLYQKEKVKDFGAPRTGLAAS